MARIINSRCVLAVRDLQASTRCYKDVLGFNQDPIDAAGWGFLTRDSFRVMLGECSNEKPASEVGDHSHFAYWNVDDVDQFYSEIVGRGALVMSEPTYKPWGLREFGLRTPDGHRITCGQVYAIVARDQHRIHFRCAEPPAPNPDKYADELLDAYLFIEDADAIYAEFATRGVEFTRGLANTPRALSRIRREGL